MTEFNDIGDMWREPKPPSPWAIPLMLLVVMWLLLWSAAILLGGGKLALVIIEWALTW